MGLLNLGTPFAWDESKIYLNHVKEHGITQFLHIWDKVKDKQGDELLWGDEIECMIIVLDDETKNAKLSLCQTEALAKLRKDTTNSIPIADFQPEHGKYMLESTPGSPYTGSVQGLLSVEPNMQYRRLLVRKHLNANQVPITLTSFPRMGAGVFTDPYFSPGRAKSTHGLFLPEEITSTHPRFTTIATNVVGRRGSNIEINIPIFIDKKTPRPFVDPTIPCQRSLYPEDPKAQNGAGLIDHIYMDATDFGGGCCSLQLTFQGWNVEEARRLYDALVPVGPIMLALTAASPIWRGYLSDVDCRWKVITDCSDDRTTEERGLTPLKENQYVIPKPRYGSVDLYLSTDRNNKSAYNDTDMPQNQEVYTRLINHGIDELLAKHMARIYIRDPLIIFSETIDQDDETSNLHMENLLSTNWKSLRLKPPPPQSAIGWRVEFRSMEVQLTDFENTAFVVFVLLLSRAVLVFNLNFYVPISKVDENAERAHKRDAIHMGKFFFRRSVLPSGYVSPAISTPNSGIPQKERKLQNFFPRVPPVVVADILIEDEYEEMSIKEIFNGNDATFPGLVGLVEAYLETLEMNPSERQQIDRYVDLVRRRANGSLQTTATWMRDFVRSHPSYKFDSAVSQEINYDLMVAIDKIERGVLRVPQFLPEDYSPCQVKV